MKKCIFLDSDILIDVYAKREPFFDVSYKLVMMAEALIFQAFTSPLIIANLFYVLQKFGGKELALNTLRKTRTFVSIVDMNQKIIDQAIHSGFSDFEDAMESFSAENAEMDALVTRNIKDYKKSKIAVLSPIEAIALFA